MSLFNNYSSLLSEDCYMLELINRYPENGWNEEAVCRDPYIEICGVKDIKQIKWYEKFCNIRIFNNEDFYSVCDSEKYNRPPVNDLLQLCKRVGDRVGVITGAFRETDEPYAIGDLYYLDD